MGLTCKYFYNLVSVLLYPTLLLMHFDTSAIFFDPFHLQYILGLSLSCVRLVAQLCLTLCDPHGLWPASSTVYGDSPGKKTGEGCHFHLQGYFPTQGSNPGIEPRSSALQADSLLSEPSGSPVALASPGASH